MKNGTANTRSTPTGTRTGKPTKTIAESGSSTHTRTGRESGRSTQKNRAGHLHRDTAVVKRNEPTDAEIADSMDAMESLRQHYEHANASLGGDEKMEIMEELKAVYAKLKVFQWMTGQRLDQRRRQRGACLCPN